MGEVADEDGGLPASSHSTDEPGVWPGRAQPQRLADLMVVGPQLDLARFVDGKNAVREHDSAAVLPRLLVLGPRRRSRAGVVRMEEPVVGLGDEVAGVREGRHPGIAVPLGVPPDVIGVHVRVDDDVDGFRRDAGALQ